MSGRAPLRRRDDYSRGGRWAEWLAERRFGGDPDTQHRFMAELESARDRVLDGAELTVSDTVLDVGCGEGLIAFGALERAADTVIFCDISMELLAACREAASQRGVLHRCQFVQAAANDLGAIADASVDVVTTRAVLIYVADKRAAFHEFARVLRPGGRISIFEPINRFALPQSTYWAGYDLAPLGNIGDKLLAIDETLQPRDSDPMFNFDEGDLLRFADQAGFFPIHLRLEMDIKSPDPRSWEGFLNSSGNPNLPTLAEAMDQALTPNERRRLIAHLRPLVERGVGSKRLAIAHLTAMRTAVDSSS
jgi:arsenite methyltransferase